MRFHKLLLCTGVALIPFTMVSAQEEQVTVRFWHTYNEVSPENQTIREVLIPLFEESHPNINVESVPYPSDSFRTALLTAAAGGVGPDLVRLDIVWSPEFAEQGIIAPIDTLMSDFQEYADRVFPGPLSTNFYDGNYYGLPLDTNTRVFNYNAAMYEAAGIEAAPATVEELQAQCELIKAVNPDAYVFTDNGTSGWNILPWIWTFGGDIVSPDMTTATGYVNGEGTVAALEFIKEMIDNGCFSDGYIGSGIDSWAGFFGGTISAIAEGPWLNSTAENQYPDVPVGLATIPAGPGGSVSVVGGENIVLFNSSPNQEAALEFLRFTQSVEYQLEMSKVGQLTVLPELLEDEYFAEHPYYGVYLEQLQTANARTPHPAYTQIDEVLGEAAQLVLRGEVSAQEALDFAAEEINAILED